MNCYALWETEKLEVYGAALGVWVYAKRYCTLCWTPAPELQLKNLVLIFLAYCTIRRLLVCVTRAIQPHELIWQRIPKGIRHGFLTWAAHIGQSATQKLYFNCCNTHKSNYFHVYLYFFKQKMKKFRLTCAQAWTLCLPFKGEVQGGIRYHILWQRRLWNTYCACLMPTYVCHPFGVHSAHTYTTTMTLSWMGGGMCINV